MPGRNNGAVKLFRLFGIDVLVQWWSWLLIAIYQIDRIKSYGSPAWSVAQYLALFVIVLMHEFGHALACRQVGGKADEIVLWPFGGVAYASPPPRPGATLWTLAAGPLVNVALAPVTIGLYLVADRLPISPDAIHFIHIIAFINGVLFVFNMLPIYPLDGGQILRALLWFVIGRVKSLFVATVIGLIGGGALFLYAISTGSVWMMFLSGFLLYQCVTAFKQALALSKMLAGPRHSGFACPSCGVAPLKGEFWLCACGRKFDTFDHNATCPGCGASFSQTRCVECKEPNSIESWRAAGGKGSPAPAGR